MEYNTELLFFVLYRNDMPESKMMLRCRRLVSILLAGCWMAIMSVDGSAETGNNCLRPCVCKWKGGKESVTCHQAGFTQVPSSGLEGTVQVCVKPLGRHLAIAGIKAVVSF